jgi:repressor LexA
MAARTRRQKEILDYIARFIERHGYEPSYAQIARFFGIKSKATIAKHIEALEKRGLLSRRNETGEFGIKLSETIDQSAICEVPLYGRIAAGAPIDVAVEMEAISVPRFMLGRITPSAVYALKVSGDSMVEDHICDGDIAIIENRTEARDGEVVVALVEGSGATLKKLFRTGREVELHPANSQMAPIRLPATTVRIQGIFRGLLRPARA